MGAGGSSQRLWWSVFPVRGKAIPVYVPFKKGQNCWCLVRAVGVCFYFRTGYVGLWTAAVQTKSCCPRVF